MDMRKKIFIDGAEGTTGLNIFDRLKSRKDLEIITLNNKDRKEINSKIEIMKDVDLTIQCLPDQASKQIYEIIKDFENIRVIDASSAHRVHPDFVYGFQEMAENQKKNIHNAKYVSNPGCYPTGFISLIRPLVEKKLLCNSSKLIASCVSGYSGGGKSLINEFENKKQINFALYGLNFDHKHLPEMKKYSLLKSNPLFMPSVSNFYQGMLVTIPLHSSQLNKNISSADIIEFYKDFYKHYPLIKISSSQDINERGFLFPDKNIGLDQLEIFVFSNKIDDQILIVARLDNLGKGACGSAIQNLNLMLGFEDYCGLKIK